MGLKIASFSVCLSSFSFTFIMFTSIGSGRMCWSSLSSLAFSACWIRLMENCLPQVVTRCWTSDIYGDRWLSSAHSPLYTRLPLFLMFGFFHCSVREYHVESKLASL